MIISKVRNVIDLVSMGSILKASKLNIPELRSSVKATPLKHVTCSLALALGLPSLWNTPVMRNERTGIVREGRR